ncbi:DUF3617 domain-containing protein [Brevundimonas sp.]
MKRPFAERPAMPSVFTRVLATTAPVIAGALFLAAPAAAPMAGPSYQAAATTPPVLPGYWEYTTSALGKRETETKCVRPSEINRFFGGLSTRHYQCTYPVREVGNGNARFEGNCVSRSGRQARIRLNGTYQPEQFSFRGGAAVKAAGIWSPFIPATITARRLAAQCPANAEYF